MMIRVRIEKVISLSDWDNAVEKTYGRIYSLQQQDGCKPRGVVRFVVPDIDDEDFENDTVPEVVNADDMGVSFKAWLARDPRQALPNRDDSYSLDLWWSRNFYPSIETVANDLHSKGLLDAGEYTINIDW